MKKCYISSLKNTFLRKNRSNLSKFRKTIVENLQKFENEGREIPRGAKDCKSCRSRKMLQNASLLAVVAVDTEENEPIKNEVWWVRRYFLGPRPSPASTPQHCIEFTECVEIQRGGLAHFRLS